VARDLTRVDVNAGSVVIKEGDPGDHYYAIADGHLEVSQQGRRLATLTRGEGFGEIALVRDVPRTATVTAMTPATLYTLDKAAFVLVLTGHALAASRADQVADLHLANPRHGELSD
jgi:CRP-like cAMP-binding protein